MENSEKKNIHLEKIKKIVHNFMKDENVKIFLFGSRARGDNTSISDVDIGIIHGPEFKRGKISLLREYIEESNIPYHVEIVDLNDVSEKFRNFVLKEAILWKG